MKKSFFDKVTNKGFVSNEAFWITVKPFLANKGLLINENITIKHKNKIATANSRLAHLFDNHCIKIVESTSGMRPKNIGNSECKSDDHLTVAKIIKHYKNHPSIETINKIYTKKENVDISAATIEERNKEIRSQKNKRSG